MALTARLPPKELDVTVRHWHAAAKTYPMGRAPAHHSPLALACVLPLTLAPTFAGVLKHAKWFCKSEPPTSPSASKLRQLSPSDVLLQLIVDDGVPSRHVPLPPIFAPPPPSQPLVFAGGTGPTCSILTGAAMAASQERTLFMAQ
jgi:hypothetical protein